MKPMKAAVFNPDIVKFPVIAQPKIDGYRCLIIKGNAYTNSMKLHPNLHLQKWASEHAHALDYVDGELIVGDPTDPRTFNQTSALRAQHTTPDFTFIAFDMANMIGKSYIARLDVVEERIQSIIHAEVIKYTYIGNMSALLNYEQECIEAGYEGVMVRGPMTTYKYGRSTAREGKLLKMKRFVDDDALIVDFKEMMHNDNEAFLNEQGLTSRSSHKENKIPAGMLGSFTCEHPETKLLFDVGGGMTMAERKKFWDERESLRNTWLKYKHLPVGKKDRPRSPIFLGLRGEQKL